MVETYGLTHIALAVRDPEQSFRFYRQVFGAVEVYRGEGFVQAQTPGSSDVLVFEKREELVGLPGGVMHFGFRLRRSQDIDLAVIAVEDAGGVVLSRGEFCPGEPYLFARDPDGYQLEIWYELPTPLDTLWSAT